MLTVEDLLDEAELLDVAVIEDAVPKPFYGYYDDERRLITIADDMRSWQMRCALCHELSHARHRDPGCMTIDGLRAEHRARRETALRLVDPVEYASAENVYEGDSYLIACELDVTVQVVEDYRRLVLDGLTGLRHGDGVSGGFQDKLRFCQGVRAWQG
jgi:hypothetical protein